MRERYNSNSCLGCSNSMHAVHAARASSFSCRCKTGFRGVAPRYAFGARHQQNTSPYNKNHYLSCRVACWSPAAHDPRDAPPDRRLLELPTVRDHNNPTCPAVRRAALLDSS